MQEGEEKGNLKKGENQVKRKRYAVKKGRKRNVLESMRRKIDEDKEEDGRRAKTTKKKKSVNKEKQKKNVRKRNRN